MLRDDRGWRARGGGYRDAEGCPGTALEANERWEQLAAEPRAENTQLREENVRLREALAQRDARVRQMAAELAVLNLLAFASPRSSAAGGEPG